MTSKRTEMEEAWALVRALASRAKGGSPLASAHVRLDGDSLAECDEASALVSIDANAERGWRRGRIPPSTEAQRFFDLYIPLCVGASRGAYLAAHLGQSLDGHVATEVGDSRFITGQENVEHTHRMRALFHAVVVGASTVENDDPQLTTRHVEGDHPTRVVIDPRRRLGPDYGLFQSDEAPTIVVCGDNVGATGEMHGRAQVLAIPGEDGRLRTDAITQALRERGLRRIFIEGGGVTVSRFLETGLLDRLHVAIAPVILGSGRPALRLPVIERLDQALTPSARHFPSGPDVLFDCALRP